MNVRSLWIAGAMLAVLLSSTAARAQTPACEALEGEQKKMVDELFAKLKPYECCTDSFAKCLAPQAKSCPVVPRLANNLCRMAALGKDAAGLEKAYENRKKSMTGSHPTRTFVLEDSARLGEASAPVTAVMYACTRCPFCRDLVLALHREVTEDALKGKVKLYLRPFPLKGHEGSTEGALALMAAGKQGKMWPFTVYTYKHFDEFNPVILADWAEFQKLDRPAFEAALADEKVREALTEVKKEGTRNKVEATPTIYIDGRLWSGELETGSIVDALLEEYDRVTRK
ncbi:MAG TPA: thioredoxin domain-containing protein [Myxococcales bacterium]